MRKTIRLEQPTLLIEQIYIICRRTKIKTNWKFDCCCSRCTDKTELETYIDAVLCMRCKKSKTLENGAVDTNIADSITEESKSPEQDKSNPTVANIGDAPYMLPKDPLDYNGQWACNQCDGEVGGFTIYSLVKELQAEVETIKGKVYHITRLIR